MRGCAHAYDEAFSCATGLRELLVDHVNLDPLRSFDDQRIDGLDVLLDRLGFQLAARVRYTVQYGRRFLISQAQELSQCQA